MAFFADRVWSTAEYLVITMAVISVTVLAVFGWQYWVAHRAWKRSQAQAQTEWPVYTESWLYPTPRSKDIAEVTDIKDRRRA